MSEPDPLAEYAKLKTQVRKALAEHDAKLAEQRDRLSRLEQWIWRLRKTSPAFDRAWTTPPWRLRAYRSIRGLSRRRSQGNQL